MKCTEENCEKVILAKGLCGTHYHARRRSLIPRVKRVIKRGNLPCQVTGCTNPYDAKDYCKRHYKIARTYSLGPDQIAKLEAKTQCDICGTERDERFAIDHDHACCSGRGSCGECIRGVLCMGCNTALNRVEDPAWAARAAEYLVH